MARPLLLVTDMNAARNLRQHVRVPVSRSASVELRSQGLSLSSTTQRRNVPVTLRDASLGGLSLTAVAEALERGATITVKITVGARTLSLPAQIVWAKRDGTTSLAGVRIHLAVADQATRKSYEGFIAENVKSALK